MTPRPMNATLADISSPWVPAFAGVRSVDRVWRVPAFEHSRHISRRRVAHAEAGRARGAADVRGQDDIVQSKITRIHARFAFEDVQPRAGDALRLQGIHERRIVHD